LTEPVDNAVNDPGDKRPADDAGWQRLAPLAIIDFFVTLIRQGIAQSLPALVVLIAGAASSEKIDLAFIVAAVTLAVVLGMVYGVLAYLRFGFQLAGDRINVRKGVLHRELLNIDRDRIQNITIHEPFYFRPFGLAALGIDTAGSSGKEIRLPGIPLADARRFRNQLVDEDDDPGPAAEESGSDEVVRPDAARAAKERLLKLTRRDVIIAGLTANFMLWAAIAIGTLFGAGDGSERIIDWAIQQSQLEARIDAIRREGGDLMAGLIALGLIAGAFLLLPVLSMIGALFRYDGYELTVRDDRFRRTSGLIGRYDESVRQHKIQAVTWKQNAMGMLLGRINLQLRQATAAAGVESGDVSVASLTRQTFPVPALLPEQAETLTARFLPGYRPATAAFTHVDLRRYLTISPLLMLTPLGLGLAGMGLLIDWRFAAAWVPIAGIVMLIHIQCWRRTGWAVTGGHGLLRSGFIGRTTSIFPLFKVQRVDVTQTNGMRRRGLAHLTVHLASHSTTLPWMNAVDARRFRDLAMYHAESSAEPWF